MTLWFTLLQVALGGALGAMSRFATTTAVVRFFGPGFPLGTMTVNVVGSFVMGAIFALLVHRFDDIRFAPLLMTGFLGGFTTFSAFSLDVIQLVEKGRMGAAAIYIGGSVGLSILALWLGLTLMRGLWA